MNVFGVLVAGRLLQTDFTQVSETEFVTEVPNAETINHVVVFLTGVQPFPDGLGGSGLFRENVERIYIRWQQDNFVEPNWHFLGFITNSKPSAIFRVAQLSKTEAANSTIFGGNAVVNNSTVGSAQIGIIVEALNTIESRVPAEGTSPLHQSTIVNFTEKMLQSFMNHIYSFVVALPNPHQSNLSTEFVPVKAVQEWFNTFQRRLQMNPNYWKS